MIAYARPLSRVRNRKTEQVYIACTREPFQVLKRGNDPALFDNEDDALQFAEQWITANTQPQSVITWYKPSDRMPGDTDELHQIFYRFNGKLFWTVAEPPTLYHPETWRDMLDINRDDDAKDIALGDVELWTELPEVPGGQE